MPSLERTPVSILAAVLLFVVSFAYYLLFLRYGINIEDEGALLYQFERLADGQRAYLDFHLGYTPGVYYVHSTLQGLFDQSIIPGRIALALTNSTSIALLVLLFAPIAGRTGAILAAACYLALLPVNPGFFASFNVPYPTWYSVTIFLGGLLACRGFLSAPSAPGAFIAGAVAGIGFLFKPNIGAFQLACTMLLVLSALSWKPSRDKSWRSSPHTTWWWGVWAATLLAVFAVFDFAPRPGEFSTFLLPVLVCGVLSARRSAVCGAALDTRRLAVVTSAVVAGFVAVSLPWIGYHAARVPMELLAREIFFIGSDYASFFYRPHPRAIRAAIGFATAALVFAAAPELVRRRFRRPALLLVPSAIAVTLAVVVALGRRPMIEGLYAAVMGEIELIWVYPATLAVLGLALVACWRIPSGATSATDACRTFHDAFLVASVGAVFLYLQVYPRTDFMHWVTASSLPVGLLIALCALARDRWARGESMLVRAAVFAICLMPLLVVCGLRFERSLSTALRWTPSGIEWRPVVELAARRAPIWMNIGKAERYRDVDRVVEILRRVSSPEDEVLAFPAIDALSFLSDRHSPIHDTYFFPGWVGHDDEAAMVTTLQADPPAFVVVQHELWPFFANAALYYYQLTDYLERDYRRLAQVGRFAILVHRDRHDVLSPVDEIPWRSQDARLAEHVARSLHGLHGQDRTRALEGLAADLIEGFYSPIVDSLADPDQGVRDAAVSALRTAESEPVGRALLEAAYAKRLSSRDETLALRRGAVWAGRESVPLLMVMADDADATIAETGAAGLGNATHRSLLRAFWPHRPPYSTLEKFAFDNAQRLRLRSWLRDPATDARIKSFAVAQAAEVGAVSEIAEMAAAARRAGTVAAEVKLAEATAEDDLAAASEFTAEAGLAVALTQLVPQPLSRIRLLYELTRVSGVPGASALALDYVSLDDVLAPRALVAALRHDEEADTLLAQRALGGYAPRYTRELLYAGATAGGCATVAAAYTLLSDVTDGERPTSASSARGGNERETGSEAQAGEARPRESPAGSEAADENELSSESATEIAIDAEVSQAAQRVLHEQSRLCPDDRQLLDVTQRP